MAPTWAVALGGGAARGWVHIGVLQALAEAGLAPQVVCGTSIGAVVGAAYASGNLERLTAWVTSLTKLEVARFFELDFSLRGVVDTDRLRRFLAQHVASEDLDIADLPVRFATVATDMENGREIWLKKGGVLDAVWASIALPGLFPAIRHRGRWLVDGGLVNPVPVSVCRALGAEVVLAVNLNADIVGKHLRRRKAEPGKNGRFPAWITEYAKSVFPGMAADDPPSLFEAVAASVNIIQDRITRSRMAGDPPEVLLAPRLGHLGLLEFHRASEAIAEGRRVAQRAIEELQRLLAADA
ncbi:MAG: Patatin [Desulfomicrobiaceae bacterium]|jgi:NTE family protein|nr:patatin-like phospholipase family protein [Desulfomicrobiaceae bacterium]MBZ4685213.1 Patatin [Desulfomicrobiaceae bacterium]